MYWTAISSDFFRNNLTSRIKKGLTHFLKNGRIVGIPDRSGSHNFSCIKDRLPTHDKTNIITFLTCFCSQQMFMRKTKYMERPAGIIALLNQKYHISKKGRKMNRTFDSLTFALRSKLINTEICPPIYHFARHLSTQHVDIQQHLVRMQSYELKLTNK